MRLRTIHSDLGARIFAAVSTDHRHDLHSLQLTPSENVLSPAARLPYVLGMYSRYFFDHLPLLGTWAFYGALDPGRVELDVLVPLLRELADARHVNLRPLSGMNAMMVVLAGLGDSGDIIVTLPQAQGGHMSTQVVAERLGLRCFDLPMTSMTTIDLDAFSDLARREQPKAVYLDQSTQLFPLDPQPLRDILDVVSPRTRIHYDSSHINGLILGGVVANPLHRGASSFGGSTHKTLPGPHKAFLATNDVELAKRYDHFANHFVSHHQVAAVMSLAITLVEFIDCGGEIYAQRTVDNAQRLARQLAERGIELGGEPGYWTGCHQVLAAPGSGGNHLAAAFNAVGLVINCLPGLLTPDQPAFRLSTAEFTRLGAGPEHIDQLADLIADGITAGRPPDDAGARIQALRQELDRPRYCYRSDDLMARGLAPELVELVSQIEQHIRHPH